MWSTAPPATNTMDLTLMVKVQQLPHSQALMFVLQARNETRLIYLDTISIK